MKMFLILAALLGFHSVSFAANTFGSACGLVDSNDEQIQEVDDVGKDLMRDELVLTPTQKGQIIIAANELLVSEGAGVSRYLKTGAALGALRKFGNGTLIWTQVQIKGQPYDEVLAMPGENPVGVLFRAGTLQVMAQINDSDVICKF